MKVHLNLLNCAAIFAMFGYTLSEFEKRSNWDRAFIRIGLFTYGKILFENHKFSHIKWYAAPDSEYQFHSLQAYLMYGQKLSIPQYEKALEIATERAQARWNEKVQKRQAVKAAYPSKKRPKLVPCDPKSYMMTGIRAVLGINEPETVVDLIGVRG